MRSELENPKQCVMCGDDIITLTRAQYCSDKCRNDGLRRYRRRLDQKKRDERKIVKACYHCGDAFTTSRLDNKFCSDQCYVDARTIVCRTCLKVVVKDTLKGNPDKYCSRFCADRKCQHEYVRILAQYRTGFSIEWICADNGITASQMARIIRRDGFTVRHRFNQKSELVYDRGRSYDRRKKRNGGPNIKERMLIKGSDVRNETAKALRLWREHGSVRVVMERLGFSRFSTHVLHRSRVYTSIQRKRLNRSSYKTGVANTQIFKNEQYFNEYLYNRLISGGYKTKREVVFGGDSRRRVDLVVYSKHGEVLFVIESKVRNNTTRILGNIGQCLLAQKMVGGKAVMALPSDIGVDRDALALCQDLGVMVCDETNIMNAISGADVNVAPRRKVAHEREVKLCCSCGGSFSSEVYRQQKYCSQRCSNRERKRRKSLRVKGLAPHAGPPFGK